MDLENKVRQQLLSRGFTKEQLLNNRGLIGAVIDEVALMIVKNLAIHSVSDCFSFARYLNEHFEYFDNTDIGDVYKHKSGDGLYSEEDIFDEWFNNR